MPRTVGGRNALTVERLRELLHYDPETGVWVRKVAFPNAPVGSIAGCRHKKHNTILIRVDGFLYTSHRLAWLYMTGKLPVLEIDHRDTDPTNNKWNNLREATGVENCANKKPHKDNKSGLKGVFPNKKRWSSKIMKNGNRVHLGTFDTPEQAHEAYTKASYEINGEFARVA